MKMRNLGGQKIAEYKPDWFNYQSVGDVENPTD